jgi:D-methionine transport system ATP-binding protein
VFDGNSSFEPVVADMVLRFRKTVNIIYADTRNIGGRAFGQMVIQLPEEDDTAEKMMEYLFSKGVAVEEVKDYV